LLRAHLVRMGDLRDAIQPLSIGEIADRSVTLAAQRWRTLLALVLIDAVPIGMVRTIPGSDNFPLLWLIPGFLVVAFLYPAALLTAVAPVAASPGRVLRAAARRFGSSFLAYLLGSLWYLMWVVVAVLLGALVTIPFIAFNAPINPGAMVLWVGGIASFVLLPRPALVASTMMPIMLLEGVSPFVALTRARRRVKHTDLRRSWLLGLAIMAITFAPAVAIGAAVEAIVNSTHLYALRLFDQLFSDAVSVGFGGVLCTVTALEMRARTEGTDLEAALESAAS
jgi:hypothetical protein